ncbi:sugar transferase [Candidatus Weimeria sp. HCP3S3_B5]|uniref:sugar transferase n=1 Tax=Candidatus Weimeria sp. HCP3S3_B5 TaxID=3438871 RepID=UPI003F8AB19C
MNKDKAKKIIKATAVTLGVSYVVLNIIARKKKKDSTYSTPGQESERNSMQGKSVKFVEDASDKENADGKCGHLEATGLSAAATRERSFYEKVVKRCLDKALSFAGLVALAPIMGGIALAIKIEDPGPVIFTQKRVGLDKQYFKLHKFRSMKMSTPHDVPTHKLEKPEQYITKVGGFIRRHSLDELPQIWDIFLGNMSVIGPRPALWNQDVLTAERDKYGANDIKPGLTGWAQINGRDELEIPDKAKLDGEYVKNEGPAMDLKCFLGSVGVFGGDKSVVEGGTGEIHKENKLRPGVPETDPEPDFGFKKKFQIDKEKNIKVLVVGAGSYIGETFASFAKEHYPNIEVDTVGTLNGEWRDVDFSAYDTIYDVAGIAHADVGNVSDEVKEKYYAVNTDLTLEIARKAKAAAEKRSNTESINKEENATGEKKKTQFIFMSSAIIYGDSAPYGTSKMIDEDTVPAPANFYGDSKWQADKGVRSLSSSNFNVAVLRPPMIYGKGSKGNYPTLAKLARKLPIFPDVDNERSMLYVGNLCEFLCQLMLSCEGGIYFPQNAEYTKTSEMVKEIRAVAGGKKIVETKALNPAVKVGQKVPGKIGGLVDKAFGNLTYDQKLSTYEGIEYQRCTLSESIEKTEGNTEPHKKHILVISQYFYPEQFRINDMACEWVKRGYKVTVLTGIPNYPMGKYFEGYDLTHKRHEIWNGVEIIRIPLIARGSNSIGMMANYGSFVVSGFFWNLVNKIKADEVFIYEVSPMTQALVGVQYAKQHKVPCYLYVTDLWPDNVEIVTGIHNPAVIGPINSMVNYVYKHCDRIFTSSQSFISKMVERGVDRDKLEFWPQYAEEFYKPYVPDVTENLGHETGIPQDDKLNIIFAGNIGYAQGLGVLVEAAALLKKNNSSARFNIVGNGRYKDEMLEAIHKQGVDEYFNFLDRQAAEDIPKFMAASDVALICLSKSEVFAMTIPAKTQSCMACGMPILVSADGEVGEIIKDAGCGLVSASGDAEGLAENIIKMGNMSKAELDNLGKRSGDYFDSHFSKKMLMDRMDEILG